MKPMTMTQARRRAAGIEAIKVLLMRDPYLTNKPNYYPGKSKPMSKATARLWDGATVTFR